MSNEISKTAEANERASSSPSHATSKKTTRRETAVPLLLFRFPSFRCRRRRCRVRRYRVEKVVLRQLRRRRRHCRRFLFV